ncbi:MAG: ankyrin repeat domain-containing protein [Longimicrobiales bacterium]
MPARRLPVRPDLRQLKHQAKDLHRAIREGDPSAITDFREYHLQRIDAQSAKLSDAQLVLARSYGASSWPRLVAVCNLIDAIWRDDVLAVRELTLANPELARDCAIAPEAGWAAAVTHAATHGLQRIITMLMQAGARDVDAVTARPELHPLLETLRLLGRLGARFPRDAVGGAVESLAGSNFAFMVEIGTEIEDERGNWHSRVALALETYARNPDGKHRILETMAAKGIPLPDTPTMTVHRGRLDLLQDHLRRDPLLLQRTFTHEEIFPPELGCHADQSLALVGAPLGGATLLHIATDYEELEVVRWLLDHGMDVNVRAVVDSDGFGGHTALFNCVVTYNAGRRDDRVARLLLDRGADPNARASVRKGLAFAKDTSVHEYRNVTPLAWGRQFHDPSYVSPTAMRVIAERGGTE